MKNIQAWQQKKSRGEKIVMVTCYDAPFAKIIAQTAIDAVLIGDTVVQIIHGRNSTVYADIQMMQLHCAAVVPYLRDQFVIGDLPFLSYRKGLISTMQAVETIMKTGVQAIKLEGGKGNYRSIAHITQSGIPVMGHIGLTPQSYHQLGGYKVQGRTDSAQQELLTEALRLQDAGCFALVLECVPAIFAKSITEELQIPTIGIGAGAATDGQILVLHDLLGFPSDISPKFIKTYGNAQQWVQTAISQYHQEVTNGTFPGEEHSY